MRSIDVKNRLDQSYWRNWSIRNIEGHDTFYNIGRAGSLLSLTKTFILRRFNFNELYLYPIYA